MSRTEREAEEQERMLRLAEAGREKEKGGCLVWEA